MVVLSTVERGSFHVCVYESERFFLCGSEEQDQRSESYWSYGLYVCCESSLGDGSSRDSFHSQIDTSEYQREESDEERECEPIPLHSYCYFLLISCNPIKTNLWKTTCY